MKIVVAHNFYQQPGGEDQCAAAEISLLKARGHDVIEYQVHNRVIDTMNRVQLASRTIWSRQVANELQQLFRMHRPQIAHFHNTFPLISPAAYYAAQTENVRVVQTLHNFRPLCVNALLFRDGKVCEDCVGKSIPWPGIVHKCYRQSRAASAATAMMLMVHRALGTWCKAVDVYIAMTEFSRSKFVEGGLPADKVMIKPNFLYPDPGVGTGAGGYAVFIGRLSAEKGLTTLLQAWQKIGASMPLKVIGDGPMAAAVRQIALTDTAIYSTGSMPPGAVYELIGQARCLVLPSECYENCPRVIIEAFAKGTPVVVSRLGAMAELVDDQRSGLHFTSGNPDDLTAKIRCLIAEPSKLAEMRHAARQKFEQRFTADANHKQLMHVYDRALARKAN
jgi:glycosyltransferase involved in cell wall biosynthesis